MLQRQRFGLVCFLYDVVHAVALAHSCAPSSVLFYSCPASFRPFHCNIILLLCGTCQSSSKSSNFIGWWCDGGTAKEGGQVGFHLQIQKELVGIEVTQLISFSRLLMMGRCNAGKTSILAVTFPRPQTARDKPPLFGHYSVELWDPYSSYVFPDEPESCLT